MRTINIANTPFPKNLIKLRRIAGLSTSELADNAGVSFRTVYEIEKLVRVKHQNGERRDSKMMQEKTLLLLAKALNTSFEALFSNYPDTPPEQIRRKAQRPLRLILIISLAIALSLIGYNIYKDSSVSHAKIEVQGNSIKVYDGVFGFLRWSKDYASNITAYRRIIWRGRDAFIYGLDAEAYDAGRIFVRDLRSGNVIWQAMPNPPDLNCIFDKKLLDTCGFGVRSLRFVDLFGDKDPELVVAYIHGRYYPYFVSIFGSDGKRIGTYYHFGHFNDFHPEDIDEDGKEELLIAGTNNKREYEGATILMLDDEITDGSSVDSLVKAGCKLHDVARVRVIFPNFDEKYMSLLGAERLRATGIKTSSNHKGKRMVSVRIGREDLEVIVTLDNLLYPVSCSISDDFSAILKKLPASEQPPNSYFDDWLSNSIRFERGRKVFVAASDQ